MKVLKSDVPAATEDHPRLTATAVGGVDGRLVDGIGNFKGHCDSRVSDATVVTRN